MNFLQFLKEDTTVIKNKSDKSDKSDKGDKSDNNSSKFHGAENKSEAKDCVKSEESFMSLFSTKVKPRANNNNNQEDDAKILENIHSDYKDFSLKTGDLIRVVRPSPRISDEYRLCDIYCGYIGIIKTRFKSTNYATVILDAPNNNPTLYFPIEYLEKLI